MSLPQTDHARDELPLVIPPGPWPEMEWHAWQDLQHLHTFGGLDELPSVSGDGFARAVRWLDEHGHRGVYRRWLRSNGVVRRCPVWCIAGHPRVAIYDPVESVGHVGYRAEIARTGVPGADPIVVQIEQWDEERAGVEVEGVETLTAGEAHELARRLAEAAVVLAGLRAGGAA